jgi:uncharacterized protein (TIGR00369 family)
VSVTGKQPIGPGAFAALLGFRAVELGPEGVVVEAMPGPDHVNDGGIVHGGFLAALLDSATGWAVHANVEAGVAVPHLQLNVQYLRAGLPGTPVVCRARCVTTGRRVFTAEAEITQAGRVVARATTTNLVSG